MKITNILAIKNRTSIENSPLLQEIWPLCIHPWIKNEYLYLNKAPQVHYKNSEMKAIKIGLCKILLTVTNVSTDIPLHLQQVNDKAVSTNILMDEI